MGAQCGANGLVDGGLVGFSLFRWNVTFLLDGKHITFATVLFLLVGTLEVGIVDMSWNLNLADIDAG